MAAEVHTDVLNFNKYEIEHCLGFLTFLLPIITTVFIALAAIIPISRAYAHYYNYAYFYNNEYLGRHITALDYGSCVFLGLAIVIIFRFEYFSSLKRNKYFYTLMLMFVFTYKLAAMYSAFTMMPETLRNTCDIPISTIHESEKVVEINYIQRKLRCCGNNNYKDYIHMEFPNNISSAVLTEVIDGDKVSMTLPTSCCVKLKEGSCSKIWALGCKEIFAKVMIRNAGFTDIFTNSDMFINVLSVILILLLANYILNSDREKLSNNWNIKEQMTRNEEIMRQY